MKVANKNCIYKLGIAQMKASGFRNLITIAAVALTTILFTTLFTVAISVKDGYEMSNFRQVGGYAHGCFKRLTKEQMETLQDDPLIREYGKRRYVGRAFKEPFHKSQLEISYCDGNEADYMFLEPIEGRLPEEGTSEAATDLRVLSLLGIEPVIGSEFTVTFDVDGMETTETFTLCGYWEYDEAAPANHLLIPQSRAEEIFDKLGTKGLDGMTGYWDLDVMFQNASHIEENLNTILVRHGYQEGNEAHQGNSILTGVNWGYMGAQLSQSIDFSTVVGIAAAFLLVIFTGYLIIYNIFQIAVANDVRFYGLLKTIGTTGRQMKRILRTQAVVLSAAGIPIGLLLGFCIGRLVTRIVIANLDGIYKRVSVNPLIFIGAAAFSLFTVLLSCRKPCRMAAAVSPVEALRYTEGGGTQKKKTAREGKKGASLLKMAWANLGRNQKKTAITVASLSLSLVILELTFIMASGFDMDKYLKDVRKDFIVADAGYFRPGVGGVEQGGVTEETITQIERQGDVEGGRTYGGGGLELLTDAQYRTSHSYWNSEKAIEQTIERSERIDGKIAAGVNLYGMEDSVFDGLTVIEGDIEKVKKDGHYIAAAYATGDYGELLEGAQWAGLGDEVTLCYVDGYDFYNKDTGQVYEDMEAARKADPSGESIGLRYRRMRKATYEVAAVVTISHKMTYRRYGFNEYVMNAEAFQKDTGSNAIMYYAFDCADGGEDAMEDFLADYTSSREGSRYDYESKKKYEAEFDSFRSMFVMVGTVLSFIVGLIGVLNFLNAILTSLITRRREFAILQSVGMTGGQLNRMLIAEGLIFAGSSVAVTFFLSVALAPFLRVALENMFWFFSYHLTVLPILAAAPFFVLLGVAVPLLSYRQVMKKSIVERLRETE